MNAIEKNLPAIDSDGRASTEIGDSYESPSSFDFNIRDVIRILLRNWLLIAATLAIALAIGVIATVLTTPKYTATASIQIDQEADRILSSDEVTPVASYQDTGRFLQTQTDVLRSRGMALRVAQELRLIGNPDFYEAMGLEAPLAETPQAQRAAAIRVLDLNLAVDLPRESRIVGISFESPDADLAARIANAYASAFISGTLERKYESTQYAREFLGEQLAEAKVRLEQSERELNDYARNANLIRTSGEGDEGARGAGSVTTASLTQLNAAANAAQTARIEAEQRWQTASASPLLSIPDVLSNPAIQALLQQRAEVSSELGRERARHREDYPTVIQLRAQVEETTEQINTLASNIRTSIQNRYEVAREQEQALLDQVQRLRGDTLSEQDRSVQYNILAREAQTNRALYDALLQRFNEVSASAGVTSNNVSIVDRAVPPTIPTSPNLLLNLALAFVAGVAVALIVVFVREQLDDSIRVPDDIEQKLRLPVLGVIPATSDDESIDVLLQSPRSSVSEAYNSLRTALQYSTSDGAPKTLLITSTMAAEGKSTTSIAIASGFARLERAVLLVDADLRRPSLHLRRDAPNALGLSDYLTGQCDLDAIMVRGEDGLTCIFAGMPPPSPTELLASQRMVELLRRLSERFDMVVLDGPPVLGLADAPIIAGAVEGVVFIVEAERGNPGATKAAVRRLSNARAAVRGAVLTKFDVSKIGRSYGYGYDYYSYGGEREQG